MKATDLMIGDWVRPDQCMVPTTYCKIEGIYPDGTVNLDKAERLFVLEELHPIPLTPEILEKNGFKDVVNPPYKERILHKVWDDYCVEINVINKDVNMRIMPLASRTMERRRGDFYFPNPEYVHELQHALKLCRIEKEIKL